MSFSLSRARLVLLAGIVTLAALFVVTAGSQSRAATATAAASCKPASYPGSGYFTSLKVSGGPSCAGGRKLQVAHYKCRVKNGKKGRCTSKVSGYSCSEVRNSVPTEIDAKVTCKNGSKKVIWTYQQNL